MTDTNSALNTLNARRQFLIYLGLGLNGFMLLMLFLADYNGSSMRGDFFDGNPFFILGYIACAAYLVGIQVVRWQRAPEEKTEHFLTLEIYTLALSAFSISAYVLNYSMRLFSPFTEWALAIIIIMHVSLILFAISKKLPAWLIQVIPFSFGISLVLSVLQVIYLSPIYWIGVIGTLFLGIALHVFVPLLLTIHFIRIYFIRYKKDKVQSGIFLSGFAVFVLFIGFFLFQWNSTESKMHEAHASIITRPNNELPHWMIFSQNWSDDWFSKRVMQGSLMFDDPLDDNSWGGGGNSFTEGKKHDPLVSLAIAIFGEIDLNREDRIKVLESQFDARHKAHRKLWSGRNLTTSDVLTNIQVMPDYRLAYVEKIITIKNNRVRRNWSSQQEAVYSFHVPEGSVVTSLSLWINGVEEKSRLTTKGKADSAYVSIVGVERRDPALLHWQEGNRITVTVFPCTPEENRIFKVGFTIPMELEEDQLLLKNIYFEGPEIDDALETTVIEVVSEKAVDIDMAGFDMIGNNRFKRTGSYRPYWEMAFDAESLSDRQFEFMGNVYHIEPMLREEHPVDVSTIYLDLNDSWSSLELEYVFQTFPDSKIMAESDGFMQLESADSRVVEDVLLKRRFSLFPFHQLKETPNALIITKGSHSSPNLSDLDNTLFEARLIEFLEKNQKVNVFQIGNEWPPYLKTLKEFGVFNAFSGELENLADIKSSSKFRSELNDSSHAALSVSNTMIVRDSVASNEIGGPDHLMRLFNYNQIVRKIGSTYFTADSYSEGDLIDLANAAYVVSPISSLIVLESEKDYDRFDIKENKNSLNNASNSSAGSVPEPHEWLLIFMALSVCVYLWYGKRQSLWSRS